ncbi:helix-turn-helix transcriptional regulator [Niabella beijingensis]|uniref:helix-turn-helix transcriptional regulator n=1 Tax=Niabella beijingensis TaxID=2872700 RepID=UPI001CBE99CF|nr:helix-turn-helix transcriptional regulator [Niabella beijingensis]MBZ4192162.1 helix-turn-helix domain-containing protein [Niabella beijingensis]
MKLLRTQLQLSQQELADLIDVSRSTITMYEKGWRNLPSAAMVKLVQLELLHQQLQLKKTVPNKQLQTFLQLRMLKVEKVLNAHARRAAADALTISFTLSHMQERYAQLQQKLAFVHHLMEDAAPDTRQMIRLRNMELNVLEAMDSCSPDRQLVAQYKLSTLKARQQAALRIKDAARRGGPDVKLS